MSRKSLAVLTGLALSFSFGLGPAQAQSIPEEIVDALNKVWGVHPGFRANHAKGICRSGNIRGDT
jgi:catalase